MSNVSLSTVLAAKRYHKDATVFGYLAVGDTFRFPAALVGKASLWPSDVAFGTNFPDPSGTFVKLSDNGWYRAASDTRKRPDKFRTLKGTAVVRVK